MRKHLFHAMLLVLAIFSATSSVKAQMPKATPEEAITALLNRIGGDGTATRFNIVIDETLDDANGKDVFIITSNKSKPCIKGNNQLSVATGINWYLNHQIIPNDRILFLYENTTSGLDTLYVQKQIETFLSA